MSDKPNANAMRDAIARSCATVGEAHIRLLLPTDCPIPEPFSPVAFLPPMTILRMDHLRNHAPSPPEPGDENWYASDQTAKRPMRTIQKI